MQWDVMIMEMVIILALILLNGLLAMSEMAIVSSRKTKLQQLASGGNAGAKLALRLANDPSNFLAAIQIGITLIGVLAGAFGGATVAGEIAKVISEIPLLAPYSNAIALGSVVLVVTGLSLVVGELVPKRIALSDAEKVASVMSRPIRLISKLAAPFVKVLSFATESILKLLRIKPSSEPPVTEEEVKIMIEQGANAGVFERVEENMMKRVLVFGDRRIGELMTPRHQLMMLNINASPQDNLKKILDAQHSYFPVFEGSPDRVIGVVSVKCILGCMAESQKVDVDIGRCLFQPLFVSETMSSQALLERFRKTSKHLALVVDEYGSTVGIVTITDVLEAIVGDLPDDEKDADTRIVQREDGSLLVDGMLQIYEFIDFFRLPDPRFEVEGDYQSLGGFVMTRLGHIPQEGDTFEWRGYRFEVVDMDLHRVDKILISPLSYSKLSG